MSVRGRGLCWGNFTWLKHDYMLRINNRLFVPLEAGSRENQLGAKLKAATIFLGVSCLIFSSQLESVSCQEAPPPFLPGLTPDPLHRCGVAHGGESLGLSASWCMPCFLCFSAESIFSKDAGSIAEQRCWTQSRVAQMWRGHGNRVAWEAGGVNGSLIFTHLEPCEPV